MREGIRIGGTWPLAALALAWAPGGAMTDAAAQPAPPSSYQLPPASPTPDPKVQGPVIEEYPVATPTIAATPSLPVITPAPRTTPTATPSPVAIRPAPRPAQAGAVPARQAPATEPAPEAAPADDITPPPTTAVPSPPTLPSPGLPATEPQTGAPDTAPAPPLGDRWPWYAAAALLAAGMAAALFRLARRRKDQAIADEPTRDTVTPPATPSPSPPAGPLATAPVPRPAAPIPSPALSDGPALTLSLEARRFSATLVNASLDYRLRVTNAGTQPLEGIVIGGDMVGAHASLPAEAQFAHPGDPLEQRHSIAALAPGETAELTGTLRLPLAAATAIRQGAAALFVPLVRLCARAGTDGPTLASTHVIGEVPARPGGGLRPFRLDLGPRIYGEVEQRNLAVPA